MKSAKQILTAALVLSATCSLGMQTTPPSPASSATPSPAPSATPESRPQRLRASQGVLQGLKIKDVAPRYPKKAREKHIAGDVLLGVTIDRKGNVANMTVLKGEPILAKAAADAVRQWKYKPYRLNGEPVEIETTVKVTFHM